MSVEVDKAMMLPDVCLSRITTLVKFNLMRFSLLLLLKEPVSWEPLLELDCALATPRARHLPVWSARLFPLPLPFAAPWIFPWNLDSGE